ncbi:MAG: MFS transporter [Planctomycetes bacterium]|nr:MFS transporter [Planctomycetota bacterium]
MARVSLRQIFFNPRTGALVGLGFASGMPNGLIGDPLKAWLTDSGVNVKEIGLFALVTFPYVFKFLWAPLLDRYSLPLLGRRRGWLVLLQALLAAAVGVTALVGPRHPGASLVPIAIAGVAIVFLSASLDIVADAYRADVLPPDERASGAATFVMGWRIAFIAGTAGAMVLASRTGWPAAFGCLALLMAATIIVTLLAPEPPAAAPQTLREAVVEPFHNFVARAGWASLVILGFVLLFKMPDVLANEMLIPLLRDHLRFSLDEIAGIRQALGFFITITGALAGGLIVPKLGMMRSLWLFGVLQAVSNLGFWFLAIHGQDKTAFVAVTVVENFCGGLVAAGFVAYLMSLCDPRYSAAQYAILSAIMAGTRLLFGPYTGVLVRDYGYANFFLISAASGVPGMLLLLFLRTPGETHHGGDTLTPA